MWVTGTWGHPRPPHLSRPLPYFTWHQYYFKCPFPIFASVSKRGLVQAASRVKIRFIHTKFVCQWKLIFIWKTLHSLKHLLCNSHLKFEWQACPQQEGGVLGWGVPHGSQNSDPIQTKFSIPIFRPLFSCGLLFFSIVLKMNVPGQCQNNRGKKWTCGPDSYFLVKVIPYSRLKRQNP